MPFVYAWPVVPTKVMALIWVAITESPAAHQGISPPGEEEVADPARAPPHPQAEGHDADEVGREDDPVGGGEARRAGAQNGHREKRARRAITARAHRATAAWIARQVPKRGTLRSSAAGRSGGAVSGIGETGKSARGGHYATISP